MNVEYGNFDKNISNGETLIHSAIDNKCDLVCLPELWSTGFEYHHIEEYSEQNSSLLDRLQAISDQSGITICGSYIEQQGQQFYNSFTILQPNKAKSCYFKKHLFSLMREDKHFSPGTESFPFISSLGLTGMSVCYDLRFPEHFLDLRLQGAEVFLMTAHWPLARIQHWDILLQARAIENQAYMIAVNSVNQSGKDVYGGHSAVIAPDGDVILRAPSNEEGLFVAEFDLEKVTLIREKFIIHH